MPRTRNFAILTAARLSGATIPPKWMDPMSESILPRDTRPEARRVHIPALRNLGIEGRARMTFHLSDNMRSLVESGVRHRHPEYDEEQVRHAVLRIMIGDSLCRKVEAARGGKR